MQKFPGSGRQAMLTLRVGQLLTPKLCPLSETYLIISWLKQLFHVEQKNE